FYNVTSTSVISTLSLHDALPILCQRTAERNGPFKLFVVVVRNVGTGRGLKRYRAAHDGVIRLCPLINGGGVYIGLERRSHLAQRDRKSTRLNSSHQIISYAVFCL